MEWGLRCAVLNAALLAACAPDLPVADEGDHVIVRSELPWCEATTDWHDEAIVTIGAWLGLAPSELPLVTVRRVETSEEAWAACGLAYRAEHSTGGETAGCAPGHDVWSNRDFLAHELVHALASRIGYPPPWLQEGLAEAIAGELVSHIPPVAPDPERLLSIAGVIDFHDSPSALEHYWIAASFVRFLLESLGRDAVLSLYASLDHHASFETVDVLVQAQHGVTLDALLEGWRARGARWWEEIAQPVLGCDAPVVDGAPVRLRPAASIFVLPRTHLRALRRLPSTSDSWSSVRLDPGDCANGAWLRVHRCGSVPREGAGVGAAPGDALRLIVPRGDAPDFVEIGDYPVETDPLACGACDVEVRADPIEVDACGSVRVDLEPGEFVQLFGPTRYVTASREEPGPITLWAVLGEDVNPLVTEVCVLDGPCGERVTCWVPSTEYADRLTAETGSLHLEIVAYEPAGSGAVGLALP